MSNSSKIKTLIYKRVVYIIRVGPTYIWYTISYTKDECLRKALDFFKVKTKKDLTKKGAEVVILLTKEVISSK